MNPLQTETFPEENDLLSRSTKKPKRKITHLIFDSPASQQPPPENNPTNFPALHQNLNPQVPPEPQVPHGQKTLSFRDAATNSSHLQNNSLMYEEEEEDVSDDDEPPPALINNTKCPIVLLSKEEKKRLRKPWKHTLIIKLFNAKIGYMSLIKRLKKKWELKGGLILTDIGHDFFIARFSILSDYNHVLTQGPWMLDDNYLTIRKWVPNFISDDSPMRFLTAWVRIPHLAVEYFDKSFLEKIGNMIGKVARIDNTTATAQRGQFTRLSVELDLSKPLLSKFWFKGRIWKIQYEGIRMICYNCGKIGHLEDKCHSNDMEDDLQEHLQTQEEQHETKRNEEQTFCKKSDLNGALKVFGRMREEGMT